MGDSPAIPDVLAEVGPRLRRLANRRGLTLTALAAKTGISKSTLSRLESGQRKPSLELLLPLAEAHQVPLDELVGAPEVGDPRIRLKPRTQRPYRLPADAAVERRARLEGRHPARARARAAHPRRATSGSTCSPAQLRLILGEHDITMRPGEVAEFDTRLPHWFGPAGDEPVEILSVHGSHGQRMHVRAAPRRAP